ncbi:Fe-S oxidoreductase [Cystobacter fuscus DSM 2262]|uniref:Fe-S oxidoreductase n=1 Tax=Cystobacter fuscus (strain ATCC 25194 / DSM 2262 / NBRC 100088 / M29) TaxID=1242864 RepID=S9PEJ7_CYSF2|nr:radical SAM protein [Cystobacter fuscus]EPX61476.1 Fe-S oxidoreductase [Cystobacter fuscus DSM 2262]
MNTTRLLVIVPPHAVSMINGSPLAPLLLKNALGPCGVDVRLFDANVRFFRWLLRPEIRQEITGELKRLVQAQFAKEVLSQDDLTQVGRLLTFLSSDYCQGNDVALLRSGMDWGGAHEVFINPPDTVPDPAFRARLMARAMDVLAEEIAAQSPEHLAFSALFHTQCETIVELCKRLRARGFQGKIILGGAAIKLSDDPYLRFLLQEASANLAYKFNLYEQFPSLAEYLAGQIGVEGVAHGTYLDAAGKLQHTVTRTSRVKKLAGPLSYDIVESESYLGDRIYPVLLSEGCYWGKCDFCDYPFLASQNPFTISATFRDPEHVVQDVRDVVERFGVKRIDLISDAVPMGYFPRLARAGGETLRALGVKMECSVRAEPRAQPQHFEAMAACGMDLVTIGVESVCDEVLEGMKKGNTYADILRCMQLARQHGIKVKANLIHDHPRMKQHHITETLTRLQEILPYIESLGVHSFGLTPHAPIAYAPQEANLAILPDRKTTNDHGQHHLQFVRTDLTPELTRGFESLKAEVESLAFELEMRRGGMSAEQRVIRLPYRWAGDHARRDSTSPDLMVEIPGKRTPFSFFVGEYAEA